MQRILILGCPGSGKSTLARRMGESLDIPVYHLDRYYWNPGWKASAPKEWQQKLGMLIAGERWILDGNYRSSIPTRLERADTVVFLDPPRRTALRQLAKRIITNQFTTRPDMADGCAEPLFDTEFLRYVWRFNIAVRPQVTELLEEFASKPGRQVVHLRSSREASDWLERLPRLRQPQN